MKSKRIILLISFIGLLSYISACEISYYIVDEKGESFSVSPDREVKLNVNQNYTLNVDYTQDHGRCNVVYDDTLFLLEEEKWKVSKDYLPLTLESKIEWEEISIRNYFTDIEFFTKEKGEFTLEIIRDCDRKEGYDESLKFKVN